MDKYLKSKLMSRHCVASDTPSKRHPDNFRTGNGTIILTSDGVPSNETLTIEHELLLLPQWHEAPKTPFLAKHLEQIQNLVLSRKFSEAEQLILDICKENGESLNINMNFNHDACKILISQENTADIKDYVQVLNMKNSLLTTTWKDNFSTTSREYFCSRADDIIAIRLSNDQNLDCCLKLIEPEIRTKDEINMAGEKWLHMAVDPKIETSYNNSNFNLKGEYAFAAGNYIVAGKVFSDDCNIKSSNEGIHIKDGKQALIIIKVKKNFGDKNNTIEDILHEETTWTAKNLYAEIDTLPNDFYVLLERHRAIHQPMFDRLDLQLGGNESDYKLSTQEIRAKQAHNQGLLPIYIESMLDMGRFFLLSESGKFPPIYGHVNINVNHQISCANISNLPELMDIFFKWIEWQLPDARENAQRSIGTRGFIIACHADQQSGRQNHIHTQYPHQYWISSSGWCLQPFLEHYYCTGDEDFLVNRMLPLYKELSYLYIDFLKKKDENGKLIFVPSYSPENSPLNYDSMLGINAAMDISVCREVLETLLKYAPGKIELSEEDIKNCNYILDNLPEYLIGDDGEIKEWACADFEERHQHRHISQLYGAYPGDEFQPELNPELFYHAQLTNRMRGTQNESCHGLSHRAQIAARLKDGWLVSAQLRHILEGGFIGQSFTTMHNPYWRKYMPDGQGAIPTIILEALVYSRPGFIELLPAITENSFAKGSLKGLALRTFAQLNSFNWGNDINLNITSLKNQTLTICYRKGFEIKEVIGAEAFNITDSTFDIKVLENSNVNIILKPIK